MPQCWSGKVRKILEYKRQAAKLLARYHGTLAKVSPAKHKAHELREHVKELKATLTPSELCELRRLRRCG
jgi:hypothetical protein